MSVMNSKTRDYCSYGNGCSVSDDLRDAKVFVVVEGDENEIKEAMKALQHASTFVRQQLALNLDLRHAPQIHFARDTVEENAVRVEELLAKITPQENLGRN